MNVTPTLQTIKFFMRDSVLGKVNIWMIVVLLQSRFKQERQFSGKIQSLFFDFIISLHFDFSSGININSYWKNKTPQPNTKCILGQCCSFPLVDS